MSNKYIYNSIFVTSSKQLQMDVIFRKQDKSINIV